MKELINNLLGFINLRLIRKSYFDKFNNSIKYIELLKAISSDKRNIIVDYLDSSKSQLCQDLFVMSQLGFKKNGFFVEFGAGDGINFSNTFLLENKFNWKGILAEPAKILHNKLKKNRRASIETDCVWKDTGSTLIFKEAKKNEFSTIIKFSKFNIYKINSHAGNTYNVKTISLEDLLKKFNAPFYIDYLSIDTEGSEFEILKNFNFNKHKFKIITCEHNYSANRIKIFNLLTNYGYKRKFAELSKWDDWYILGD